MIDWEDAIDEAKDNLRVSGYVEDFEEVIDEAKSILSSNASMEHLLYLKSEEWKVKRKRVLERDNYVCQDCLEFTKEVAELFKKVYQKKISYFRRASQVHHLNYDFKQTESEEEYCISLCGICHQLRHCKTTVHEKMLRLKLDNKIFMGIYRWLLKQPEFIDDFIKSLTVKPNDWLKEEVKDGERRES